MLHVTDAGIHTCNGWKLLGECSERQKVAHAQLVRLSLKSRAKNLSTVVNVKQINCVEAKLMKVKQDMEEVLENTKRS